MGRRQRRGDHLVQPLSPDDYESKQYHSLAVGRVDGVPTTTLISRHGDLLYERRTDCATRLHRTGETTTYAVDLPWDLFKPFAPPLDQEMGLNVFYLAAGTGADRPVYA